MYFFSNEIVIDGHVNNNGHYTRLWRIHFLPSKYILSVLFTPCNLHWVILTSSSRMVIMLLNSRTAWQSTGYPWKSLVKLVISLYEAISISSAGRWICGSGKKTNINNTFKRRFFVSTIKRIPETSLGVRVENYGTRLRFSNSIPSDRTVTDRWICYDWCWVYWASWYRSTIRRASPTRYDPTSSARYRSPARLWSITIKTRLYAFIPQKRATRRFIISCITLLTSEWPLSFEILLCDKSTNLSSFSPLISVNENSVMLLYDKLISDNWVSGNSELFRCLMQLLLSSNTSIILACSNSSDANYTHTHTHI